MIFDVHVISHGDLYREFFNAIASTFRSDGYGHLLNLTVLFAGCSALLTAILKRHYSLYIKWLIMYLVLYNLIFLPRATVHIEQHVIPVKHYQVDNVPLGLALIASISSQIGYGLTSLLEGQFTMVGDFPYQSTGMVFASRLVSEAANFRIIAPALNRNVESYIHQCVYYDLLLHLYSATDLSTSNDAWEFVSEHTSKARLFRYNQQLTPCTVGAAKLTKDWNKNNLSSMTFFGRRLFSGSSLPRNLITGYLHAGFEFLNIDVRQSGEQLMRQIQFSHALSDALVPWNANQNINNLANYAFVKSNMQRGLQFHTLGEQALYWLPLFNDALTAVLYACFIFIFLFSIFPGGIALFKQYCLAIVWLQLWAPLFAIINLIASFYAQTATSQQAADVTLNTLPEIININHEIVNVTGYLLICVPMLSAGLLRGMMQSMLSVASVLSRGGQYALSQITQQATSGNIDIGNTHFNTHAAENTSANHFNDNINMESGAAHQQLPSGATLSSFPAGNQRLDESPTYSDTGIHLDESQNYSEAFRQKSEEYRHEAKLHQEGSTSNIRMALQKIDTKTHESSDASTHSDANETITRHVQSTATDTVKSDIENYSKTFSSSREDAYTVASAVYHDEKMSANISANSGKSLLGAIAKVMTGAEVSGSAGFEAGHHKSYQEENTDRVKNMAEQVKRWSKARHFTEHVSDAVESLKHHSSSDSHSDSTLVKDDVVGLMETAQTQHTAEMSSIENAKHYGKIAEWAESHQLNLNQSQQNQFVDWLQHKNYSLGAIDRLSQQHPQKLYQFGVEFLEQKYYGDNK